MAEDERDYTDYLQHMSNNLNGLFLYSGFTLTTITVLISILPNPKSMLAQITLFFLFALLSVFTLLMAEIGSNNLFLCRNVPPQTTRIHKFNIAFWSSQSMWSIAVILMFLLSELTYLAIASTITHIIGATFGWIAIVRPFMKRRKLNHQKTE